jgi:hypothetical protein
LQRSNWRFLLVSSLSFSSSSFFLQPEPVFDFVTKSTVQFTACGLGYFSKELWGPNLGGLYGWHGFGGFLLLCLILILNSCLCTRAIACVRFGAQQNVCLFDIFVWNATTVGRPAISSADQLGVFSRLMKIRFFLISS